MTPALALVVRGWIGDYRFSLAEQCRCPSIESELKMNFENSTDVVCITSDEGDALVPGTHARAVAEQQANATCKPVTIRNPVTDKVLATVRPASGKPPAEAVAPAAARCGDGDALDAGGAL